MSFWNNPSASFQQLGKDPWRSMQNFATTGLVPLIPYIGGIVGGIFGGPGGAAAGGAIGQEGVDYFSGNREARTGKGILGSLTSGAGKGSIANAGYGYFSGGGLTPGEGGTLDSSSLNNPLVKQLGSKSMNGLSGLLGGGSQSQPTDQTNQTQQMQQQQSLSARADQLRSHIAMLKSQRASMGGVLSTVQA